MIRHMVMFRLKESAQKQQNIITLKEKLEELKPKIPSIRRLETGVNFSTVPAAYDLVLLTEFNSPDDLENYKIHPDHQKLVEYLNTVKDTVAVVDHPI